RVQAVLRRGALVHPREDRGRVVDRAFGSHQDRNRPTAARAACGEAVDALHVWLLAVGHARALQGPPRLLAVMADGDRDEAEHAGPLSPFGNVPGEVPR